VRTSLSNGQQAGSIEVWAGIGAERLAQQDGGLRRDRPLAVDDLINAETRHAHSLREFVPCGFVVGEKLLPEYLTRNARSSFGRGQPVSSA
jgi:hypothetical protein